ncbi:MAG TPA: DnaB-like helicase C-terminal domain-containing protein [Actinomycetota bacterium]
MAEPSTGPVRNRVQMRTVQTVLDQLDKEIKEGAAQDLVPVPTHFQALDSVLGGGVRAGDLLLIGGMPGVGKTIVTLQWARNMALSGYQSLYVCYEHEESSLLGRLLALELGDLPHATDDSEMEKLRIGIQEVAMGGGRGLRDVLGSEETIKLAYDHVESYSDRLWLMKASGATTGVGEMEDLVKKHLKTGPVVLFVDYLQKVSVRPEPPDEAEKVTRITEALKDLALTYKIPIVAVVAADREGLKSRRLRLHHLRGSSALAYEADIALILNDKFNCVSKVHLAYDPVKASTYHDYTIFTLEKNRGGPNLIDLQFKKDFLYYRFNPIGGVVSEQLIDERIHTE